LSLANGPSRNSAFSMFICLDLVVLLFYFFCLLFFSLLFLSPRFHLSIIEDKQFFSFVSFFSSKIFFSHTHLDTFPNFFPFFY
jgi:hypothetical protein